jgi:hypothetical protein
MITAIVPTQRPKLVWQDIINSKEDYTNLAKSGMMYVYFPDITWKEVEEYLKNKEK